MYSDADWIGNAFDRRSTSGYFLFLCNAQISWSSKSNKLLLAHLLKLNIVRSRLLWLWLIECKIFSVNYIYSFHRSFVSSMLSILEYDIRFFIVVWSIYYNRFLFCLWPGAISSHHCYSCPNRRSTYWLFHEVAFRNSIPPYLSNLCVTSTRLIRRKYITNPLHFNPPSQLFQVYYYFNYIIIVISVFLLYRRILLF